MRKGRGGGRSNHVKKLHRMLSLMIRRVLVKGFGSSVGNPSGPIIAAGAVSLASQSVLRLRGPFWLQGSAAPAQALFSSAFAFLQNYTNTPVCFFGFFVNFGKSR